MQVVYQKINQMKELPAIVARTEVGKKVEVKIWRDKKEIIKNVILGRLETSDDFKISKSQETQEQNNEEIIESLRIAEKIRKKIGIDIDTKPETVTEENLAPVTEAKKEEAPKAEAAPVAEAKKEEAPKVEAKTEKKLENTPEKKHLSRLMKKLFAY